MPHESGGGELEGSTFLLPGMAGSQNTQSYPWQSGRPYRLRVFPSPHITQAWRAEVTDLSSGKATPIRDLYTDGDSLAMPMVWTESFADCAAPPVTVRWSHLRAVDSTGRILTPHSLLVNYQGWERGLHQHRVETDARGVLQVTCTRVSWPSTVLLTASWADEPCHRLRPSPGPAPPRRPRLKAVSHHAGSSVRARRRTTRR